MKATPCESCDNVTLETRKQSSRRWCCIKFPKLEGFNPVAPHEWLRDGPYMNCNGINGGFCQLWTERRNGKIPAHGSKD